MKRKITCILFAIALTCNSFAQGDTLIGTVADQIIKICQNDAGITTYQTIGSLPGGNIVSRLVWSPFDQCYYSIDFPGAPSNEISVIDINGNYSIKGTVTVPGYSVYFLEGIAIDKATGEMYVSASLNGNNPSDYWSETLLKIDTATLQGTIIGEFSHTGVAYDAEADVIYVENGILYYLDVEGGGSPWIRFYKQDIAMLNVPVLMYEDLSGGYVGDFTVKYGFLYYAKGRDLKKIDVITFAQSDVGTMFSPSAFGGALLYGLDWQSFGKNGIEDHSAISAQIYPTVSSGLVTIKTAQNTIDYISIFDANGKLIKSFSINASSAEIDLSDLSAGVYLLNVQCPNGFSTSKLVLE